MTSYNQEVIVVTSIMIQIKLIEPVFAQKKGGRWRCVVAAQFRLRCEDH